MSALPKPIECSRCGIECWDHRSSGVDVLIERVCITCVADEYERLRREDALILDRITSACVKHGFDVDGEPDEAMFIAERLGPRDAAMIGSSSSRPKLKRSRWTTTCAPAARAPRWAPS
jgi:hypothetical protein